MNLDAHAGQGSMNNEHKSKSHFFEDFKFKIFFKNNFLLNYFELR